MSAVLNRIRVVLVNTSHPGNIGAAARAMKIMGLSRLYLVAPRAEFPSDKATWRAVGAADLRETAVVVVCDRRHTALRHSVGHEVARTPFAKLRFLGAEPF